MILRTGPSPKRVYTTPSLLLTPASLDSKVFNTFLRTFQTYVLNEKKNHCILIPASLNFVTKGLLGEKTTLVQVMSLCRQTKYQTFRSGCNVLTVRHRPLNSFTVPLHSPDDRHLLVVRAVQRDCHWSLRNSANSHWSREPIMQWALGNPIVYIDQPITHKGDASHVSYATDSPITTRLGLCSSLTGRSF